MIAMPTITRSRFVLTATTVAVGTLLAGCATPKPAPPAHVSDNAVPNHPARVTSIPRPTGPNQLSELPIMAYLLSPAQEAQLTNATDRLVTTCMRRLGFDYSTPAEPTSSDVDNDPNGYLPDSDPRLAASQGYRDRSMAKQARHGTAGAPMSQAEVVALVGHDAGAPVNGQVSVGGCLGSARRTVAGSADPDIVFGDSTLASDIRLDGYTKAQSDSRVTAVFGQWSVCMKAKGFDYASPIAAVDDPRWDVNHPPSTLEIRTAVADVACKYQDNVNGVFHAVETAFEDAAIQQHLPALQQITVARGNALEKAAQTLAR
jgi:hypothetical protein